MTAAEQSRVYRRYTDNVAAYELYLLGRSKLAHYTKDDTLAAIKAFEDALRLDANYALGACWPRGSECFDAYSFCDTGRSERMGRTRKEIRRIAHWDWMQTWRRRMRLWQPFIVTLNLTGSRLSSRATVRCC